MKWKKKKTYNQDYSTWAKTPFRFKGEIKRFTDKQIKRIQHHQTNSTINAKGISLDRKHEKERQTKQTPSNKVSGSMIIYINTYLTCTWAKCSN